MDTNSTFVLITAIVCTCALMWHLTDVMYGCDDQEGEDEE